MEGLGFFVMILLLNAFFWIAQFIDLMMMPDDDFPGRFDKVLWVVVFLVLFVLVAPVAFGLWKEKNRRRLRSKGPPAPTTSA
jgi:hypothetical protein